MSAVHPKYHGIIAEAITKAVCVAYNMEYVAPESKERLYTAHDVRQLLDEAIEIVLTKL